MGLHGKSETDRLTVTGSCNGDRLDLLHSH